MSITQTDNAPDGLQLIEEDLGVTVTEFEYSFDRDIQPLGRFNPKEKQMAVTKQDITGSITMTDARMDIIVEFAGVGKANARTIIMDLHEALRKHFRPGLDINGHNIHLWEHRGEFQAICHGCSIEISVDQVSGSTKQELSKYAMGRALQDACSNAQLGSSTLETIGTTGETGIILENISRVPCP